jgi:hypothetical protein
MTATMDATVLQVPLSAIDVGERAGRSMGDLGPLMASITGEGLLFPVSRTPAGRLVLGARRLEACRMLGWRSVPAVTLTGIWEALERLELERSPDDLPFTVADAMGADMAWRELQWWPKQPMSPRGTGRAVDARDRHRRMVAVACGLNTGQYRMARTLTLAARGYSETYDRRTPVSPETRQRAVEALATIGDRSTILRAYRRYLAGQPASTATGRRPQTRSQARSVSSALAALSGITTGLANVTGVDPATPRTVSAQWEADAVAAKRALTAFLRIVKEHNK